MIEDPNKSQPNPGARWDTLYIIAKLESAPPFSLMAFAMSPHSPLSSKLQRRGPGTMGGTLFEMGIRNLNRHKDKDNGNGALPLVGER